MKKRWIVLLVAAGLLIGYLSILYGVFPEKAMVKGNANSVESIDVEWCFRSKRVVTITDSESIEAFFQALRQSSRYRCNALVTHSEGLYSEPVYTLEVHYKNGKSVYLTTGEGGNIVYRFIDPAHRGGGEKSYVSVHNEALREWAESMV